MRPVIVAVGRLDEALVLHVARIWAVAFLRETVVILVCGLRRRRGYARRASCLCRGRHGRMGLLTRPVVIALIMSSYMDALVDIWGLIRVMSFVLDRH